MGVIGVITVRFVNENKKSAMPKNGVQEVKQNTQDSAVGFMNIIIKTSLWFVSSLTPSPAEQ